MKPRFSSLSLYSVGPMWGGGGGAKPLKPDKKTDFYKISQKYVKQTHTIERIFDGFLIQKFFVNINHSKSNNSELVVMAHTRMAFKTGTQY